jgi:hypothetical protein
MLAGLLEFKDGPMGELTYDCTYVQSVSAFVSVWPPIECAQGLLV